MPLTRTYRLGLSIVMIVTVFSSVSSAQIKRPMRWLGQGFSDGYHQCAPGPNSDYYNPYSAHNSVLHSQAPMAFQDTPYGNRTLGRVNPGGPFSVYGAPAAVTPLPTFEVTPVESFDNSFVPFPRKAKPKSENDWQIIPKNSGQAIKNKNDSALVPRLRNRIKARTANANASNAFSILDR